MRTAPRLVSALLFVCLGFATPAVALAQQRPPQTPAKSTPAKRKKPKKPRPPMFVTLGASAQVTGNNATQSLSFPLYGEAATASGPATFGVTPSIDFGFGIQTNKRFSIGTGVGFFWGSGHLDATESLPNPLIFNANRSAQGSASASRHGVRVDIEFAGTLTSLKTWRIEAVGGPTFAWITQQLSIDTLSIVEGDYPYDTVSLQPASSPGSHSAFSFGAQIGMRLTRQFNKRTGVTFSVRYRITPFHPDVDGTAQKLGLSGLHIGGGLKFVF